MSSDASQSITFGPSRVSIRLPWLLRIGVAIVVLLIVAVIVANALSASENREPAKKDAHEGDVLRQIADSSTLEIRISNPGHDPNWLHDCDAIVRKGGMGEVVFPSGTTTKSKRAVKLDAAQRLILLDRVRAGLSEFQIEYAHPESDKLNLRLTVAAGSATITATGCYQTDFVLTPLSFLTTGNVGANEDENDAPVKTPPEKKTAPDNLDDAIVPEGQVAMRRGNRPLIGKDLPTWKVSLEIVESKRRLARVTLDVGWLRVDADKSAFPELRSVSKTMTKGQRDAILRVAAKALERFSLAEPREVADRAEGLRRECKLSIATRYSMYETRDTDFEQNQRFVGDVQKIIDAVGNAIGSDN